MIFLALISHLMILILTTCLSPVEEMAASEYSGHCSDPKNIVTGGGTFPYILDLTGMRLNPKA